MLQGARESVFTTKADHSFFTEPVSCVVFNAVGKTNVSILVDVHCESHGARLTSLTLLWPTSLTTALSERAPSAPLLLLWLPPPPPPLIPLSNSYPFVLLHYCTSTRKQTWLSFLCLQSVPSCWWSRSQRQ